MNEHTTITVKGVDYQIIEQTMRVIMPLLKDTDTLALEVMKRSVHYQGQPIGDAVLDFGFADYQRVMNAVNEVHGLAEEKND